MVQCLNFNLGNTHFSPAEGMTTHPISISAHDDQTTVCYGHPRPGRGVRGALACVGGVACMYAHKGKVVPVFHTGHVGADLAFVGTAHKGVSTDSIYLT